MNEEKVKCPVCSRSAVYTKNDGVIVCDKNFGKDHKFMFGYSVYAENKLGIRSNSTWEDYERHFGTVSPYKPI